MHVECSQSFEAQFLAGAKRTCAYFIGGVSIGPFVHILTCQNIKNGLFDLFGGWIVFNLFSRTFYNLFKIYSRPPYRTYIGRTDKLSMGCLSICQFLSSIWTVKPLVLVRTKLVVFVTKFILWHFKKDESTTHEVRHWRMSNRVFVI